MLDADPAVMYPRCVKGRRGCPPEDCGGPWGYQDFLEAVKNPEHSEHEEMLEWAGQGVLMSNAANELRGLARLRGWKQAPDNDRDGVASVLEAEVARLAASSPK